MRFSGAHRGKAALGSRGLGYRQFKRSEGAAGVWGVRHQKTFRATALPPPATTAPRGGSTRPFPPPPPSLPPRGRRRQAEGPGHGRYLTRAPMAVSGKHREGGHCLSVHRGPSAIGAARPALRGPPGAGTPPFERPPPGDGPARCHRPGSAADSPPPPDLPPTVPAPSARSAAHAQPPRPVSAARAGPAAPRRGGRRDEGASALPRPALPPPCPDLKRRRRGRGCHPAAPAALARALPAARVRCPGSARPRHPLICSAAFARPPQGWKGARVPAVGQRAEGRDGAREGRLWRSGAAGRSR